MEREAVLWTFDVDADRVVRARTVTAATCTKTTPSSTNGSR